MFGTDYPTKDGTAVRDYVHVSDLATAHLRALERLARGGASRAINLGTGRGHSVRQVIRQVERTTGLPVPVNHCPRRAGDPAILVAEVSNGARELGWAARHSSLESLIETAWQWYRRSKAQVGHASACPSEVKIA